MKKDNCLIYLGDLVHDYASKGPHTFPINIGYICAYAKKRFRHQVSIRLFKYPLDLINALNKERPDILGLSNYTWNLSLNNRIILLAKSLSKEIITIYGGPDYPVVREEAEHYLLERPDLDFYVFNQGESGFANIIERYFLCDCSLEEMKGDSIENCSFYDRRKKRLVVSDSDKLIVNLEEIPSPYLSGILDEFFSMNLIPLLETNRGCPYSCTFCAWGKSSHQKILVFPMERIKQEIEYIAERIRDVNSMRIVDANFGILERDIEICKILRCQKDKLGRPRDLTVACAKMHTDRIIEMIDILGDMIGISTSLGSFQTLDPKVMANIKRTSMSIERFGMVQLELAQKGVSTSTELIVGLPGETKTSHLKALRDLFGYNAAAIICYNLFMLGGSEMNTSESRKRFGIKTKIRLLDGAFGEYDNFISLEYDEVVLGTNTMTMDDILYFRPVHFLIQFLWNYGYYKEILFFLKKNGINPLDVIIALIENRETAAESVRKMFYDFMRDTYGEWFDSKEKLYEYYSKQENFDFISRGGFGKLNYKYTFRFLLECKSDFDKYVFKVVAEMLEKNSTQDRETEKQLEDLFNYTRNAAIDMVNCFKPGSKKKIINFEYDIPKWKSLGYKNTLSEHRRDGLRLKFELPDEQINALKKLYHQFGSTDINQTLRKMSEYMNENDLFYRVEYA